MSGFLKLILVGLAILFVYGYVTRPGVPPNQTTATPVPDYSGFRSQAPGVQETTAAQDGAALAARDEMRRRADPSQCLVLQSPKTVADEYSVSITGAIKNNVWPHVPLCSDHMEAARGLWRRRRNGTREPK